MLNMIASMNVTNRSRQPGNSQMLPKCSVQSEPHLFGQFEYLRQVTPPKVQVRYTIGNRSSCIECSVKPAFNLIYMLAKGTEAFLRVAEICRFSNNVAMRFVQIVEPVLSENR